MKPIRWMPEMIEEYTKKGWWNPITWPEIYDHNAFLYADKEAVVSYWKGERRSVTWKELKQITDRLALGLLELGLKRDDRVLCQLPNCIENVAVRVACEKAGLIHCYSAIYTWEIENDYFLRSLEAAAVVTIPQYHGRSHYELFKGLRSRHPYFKYLFLIGLEEEVPKEALSISRMMQTPLEQKYPADYLRKTQVDAYEVSHVMTTTGTTGLPKLIEASANSLRIYARGCIECWKIGTWDIGFTTAFLWSGSANPVNYVIPQVGGTMVIAEIFEPGQALQIIEKEKPTYYSGFPSQIIDMVNHPDFDKRRVNSLRFLGFAGAPFPKGLARECEEKIGGLLLNGYGTVDSFSIFMVSPDDPLEVRLGSVGKVPRWDEYKIVNPETGELIPPGEVGILYWRGASGSGGYYEDAEKTVKVWGALGIDGWCNTEDLAKADREGRVWLMGRSRDMILRGGQNIFPQEIEDLLGSHPKVAKACIVPMPDARLGERTCAYVISREGEKFTLEDMIAYLEEKGLAKYKFPERLEMVREFPMVSGKEDKRALVSDVCNKLLKEGELSKELVDDFAEKGKLRPELLSF